MPSANQFGLMIVLLLAVLAGAVQAMHVADAPMNTAAALLR
ncbi:MAG: hypothetical protein ACREF3_10305 [Acetobacteraceae bacterium]